MKTVCNLILSLVMLLGAKSSPVLLPILLDPDVARVVLLDPPILKSLHVETSKGQPFLLSDDILISTSGLNLPFKVLFVKSGDKRGVDAFRFTNAATVLDKSDGLLVTFIYPPQGISGHALVRRGAQGWEVVERQVSKE
jgi:hypothetical protein